MNLTGSKPRSRFVLHEHWASHHHFDFRLERRGVLKSWALPKGMPVAVGERHFAVEVENHPISYINFQGKIPEGQYGAGIVKIKDQGQYTPVEWTPNKIEVILHGKKFKGKYVLVPFKKEWLIIKGRNTP
jgi:bifunctional non-homologous end joining protein LigD